MKMAQTGDYMIHRVKSYLVCLHTGDNILTAVNVARNCGMVGSDEKIIFVNATPHTEQSMPTLRFSLEDTQSSVEVITQVGSARTLLCSANQAV